MRSISLSLRPASLTTDPLLNTKGSKTSHDVLIDTLSRSDNLRSLEGSYTGSSSHLQNLREALYRSISKVTSQDAKTFIQNDNILTPDDTKETHINLVNFELESSGYPPLEDQDDIKFVSACIENTYPGEYDEVLPELTESKEEVISFLRSIEPLPRLPIMKTKYCRYLDRRNLKTDHTEGSERGATLQTPASALFRNLHLSFTVRDREGVVYNVACHHLREEIHETEGAPVWDKYLRCLSQTKIFT